MSNLTKKLQKLAKKNYDAIYEEIKEQHEASRFNRLLLTKRKSFSIREIKSLSIHIK